MKRLFICMAVISATVFGFSSCNNEDETVLPSPGQTADLRIETEIVSAGTGLRSTKAALSSFPEGSALSLFVTSGTLGSNYPQGPYNNVKAEYKSGKWELTPTVKLGDTPATIFAFYPYNTAYTNGASNMIVSHTNQVDYMYGTNAEGQGNIDRENPNVRLRMKHAKALLQFNIKKMNYPGEGKLTRIEVANINGKNDLFSAASLNISTGELTNIGGQYNPAYIENVNGLYTLTEDEPAGPLEIMVIPVSKSSANGSIVMRFFIDGAIYTYNVPVNTAWKQGTKYLYNVTFNGTELVVDDIVITGWTEGAKGEINLY
ncbi:fimbrillin family protein [Dysgonomonas macrotermitis]|uniref:Fimbrillin-like n=1 Tax=Dysgonomonas macrotermitis TaxID=1346286 RepID=A0A1M5JMX5_9BACT|nr:fimbrillin family protein [Dysgonomonas macrotermitis]SHG41610.1 Fimbrillin-like [Dysgonomonas macrotermitis]